MFLCYLVIFWVYAQILWDARVRYIVRWDGRDERAEKVIRAAFCAIVMFGYSAIEVSVTFWMAYFIALFCFNLLPIRVRIL